MCCPYFQSRLLLCRKMPVKSVSSTVSMAAIDPNETPLVDQLRNALLRRGVSGIKYIGRLFRIMDDNGNKRLDYDEFVTGIKDSGLDITEEEGQELCRYFDKNADGNIDMDEFLLHIRPPMNRNRMQLIEAAWRKLDINGDGVLTVEDVAKKYDARKHPKYLSGEWTEEQVFAEFLKSFDTPGSPDEQVTFEEWVNYYSGVSASIDNDMYFDLLMRKAWKL